MKNYLNFESEIKNLELELDKLKDPYNQGGLSEVDTQNISIKATTTDQLGFIGDEKGVAAMAICLIKL